MDELASCSFRGSYPRKTFLQNSQCFFVSGKIGLEVIGEDKGADVIAVVRGNHLGIIEALSFFEFETDIVSVRQKQFAPSDHGSADLLQCCKMLQVRLKAFFDTGLEARIELVLVQCLFHVAADMDTCSSAAPCP